ncbi:MAG: hypothetical protein ACFFDF_20280 [Candidatus Odinarchaeota archaeon]
MVLKKDRDLAEFIGIYLGTGKIFNDRLVISIDKERDNYVNYVSNLIKRIFEINPEKVERTYLTDLIISDKEKIRVFMAFLD